MGFLFTLGILTVFVAIWYLSITHQPSLRQSVPWILLCAALTLFYGGATIALAEHRRSGDGRVTSGVIVGKEKSSVTGSFEPRRRWRAGQALPSLLIAVGYEWPEAIARLIATGSTRAWAVEYRFDCGAAMCRGRDLVSERLWSELFVGKTVSVRPGGGHGDLARLDANSPWSFAIAKLGLGMLLVLGAGLASGRWKRGPKYLTVPAVVIAVDPVDSGQAVRWRVQFAYFAADGTVLESADEVVVAGVKPGDDCIATYPTDHPDLGTLQLLPRT